MKLFLNGGALAVALFSVANGVMAQAEPVAAPPPANVALTSPGTSTAPPDAVAGPATGLPPAPEVAADSAATPQEERSELRHPNRPLLITGGAVLVAAYGASAIVAGASDRKSNDQLFYPVVGPWFALHDMNCDETACKREGLYKALLIGDAAVQGAGVVALLLGAILPESRKKPWYLIGSDRFVVAPQFGSSTLGLGAAGKF